MNHGDCLESELEVAAGSTRLHCRIAAPASTASARLLIIHGYGEHAGRYIHFMRWMAARGVRCEAIDLRGHGRSSGRRGFVREWDEYLHDIQAFFDSSRRASGEEKDLPVFALGHSHGGLVTAAAGERGILNRAAIVGCVLSSPYLATLVPPPAAKRILAGVGNLVVPWLRVRSGLRREWLSSDPAMLAEDEADELMNHSATPRWFFTMRRQQTRVLEAASTFALPFLCLTGAADVIADPSVTADFYRRAASADKSIYVYSERLHELLRDVGRERVFGDILGWIQARSAVLSPQSPTPAASAQPPSPAGRGNC